jgi:hypothetical protein
VLNVNFTAKYSYGDEIKEVEEDTFECTTDFIESGFIIRRCRENACVQGMVPMDSTLNYFECEIVSKGDVGDGIWVGIGPWSDIEDSNPQMGEYGMYYMANAGYVRTDGICCGQDGYEIERGPIEIGSTCTTGDRIGCGIDFDDDHHSDYIHVFFTKNGKQLGDRIRCVMPPFKMCPMVGMGEKGQRIHFTQHSNRPSLLSVS